MASPRILMTVFTASASVLFLQPFSLVNSPNQTTASATNPFFAAPAFAGAAPAYKPPIRPRPAGPTSGTGSRGCDSKALPVPLTPLVPNGHVGQTVSGRPTFFWYLADTRPVHFALVEQGVPKPIYETTVQANKPGIMQITVPDTTAELTVGKEYRWSVAMVCSEQRFSNNVFAQSWIERVELSPELKNQMSAAQSDQERAQVYAGAGLWFDALATLSKAGAHDQMLALIEQVELRNVADYERSNARAAMPTPN